MAGIYIHIPFCKKKCIYCDFYSVGGKTDTVDAYVQSLCQEAAMRSGNLQGEAIKTIYIGGGTPSLLSATQLSRLVGQLGGIFDLRQVEEFTIEVNPDDVTDDAVEAFMQLGINRVSMGVQSFVDAELQFLRRRHDAARAGKGKSRHRMAPASSPCGKRGIRTPGASQLNGFQDRRNRPLCHLSATKV